MFKKETKWMRTKWAMIGAAFGASCVLMGCPSDEPENYGDVPMAKEGQVKAPGDAVVIDEADVMKEAEAAAKSIKVDDAQKEFDRIKAEIASEL